MPLNLLLIGPPGVGKGTQAALLTQRLGLLHLASGDVFRNEIAIDSNLGRLAKKFIDDGQLVPDDVTISMMEGRIASRQSQTSGFVLDGYPRTLAQAEALDDRMCSLGIAFARIIVMTMQDDLIVSRIGGRRSCERCGEVYHVESRPPAVDGSCDKCGSALVVRPDDTEETMRKRLVVYHKQTEPLLDFYQARGNIHLVDASGSAEEVYQRAIAGLAV